MCVSAIASASAQSKPRTKVKPAARAIPRIHFDEAYYGGDLIKVHTGPRETGERPLLIGPWNFGPKVSSKPKDKRPNLYIVVPGSLHRVASYPDYDHTEILSAAPDDPKDFDVYWALVLDPSANEDFTAERQLIMATQGTFNPDESFTFDQIPCAGFLRDHLKITTLKSLDKYRRPDGSLPRVAIVSAGFAVRLNVEKPDEPDQKQAEQPATTPPADH